MINFTSHQLFKTLNRYLCSSLKISIFILACNRCITSSAHTLWAVVTNVSYSRAYLVREHVLKEDFSFNGFDHGRACLTGGCVLSETMSYGLI